MEHILNQYSTTEKYLDTYYFENCRVSYILDLMESEWLIRCAQRLFITTSGTNNEAVRGRTWLLVFPSLSSAVKAKGPLPCHRASTRLPLGALSRLQVEE